MTKVSFLADERRLLYSPIALMIRDALTGQAPLGQLTVKLECELTDGTFEEIQAKPSVSSQNIWSFPGLGRSVPVNHSPQTHRVIVSCDLYEDLPTIDFEVHHYDDRERLKSSQFATAPKSVFVMPNDKYPFPKNLPVVRGRVFDSNGDPANDVPVSHNSNPAVTTGESGFFSLDIRWPPPGTWPPTEIFLRRSSAANSNTISVNSITGVRAGDQVELVEDIESQISLDALVGQNTIAVTNIESFDESADVILDSSVLKSFERRFGIATGGINLGNETIALTRDLPVTIPVNTPVLHRSRRFEVDSINPVDRTVTLVTQLNRRWGSGTRVVRFSQQLELDVESETHSIPIPDGFRFFEIQLS